MFVSFYMPSSDVLELSDVLYVPSLTKNLLTVSNVTYLKCLTEFDNNKLIIRDCDKKDG